MSKFFYETEKSHIPFDNYGEAIGYRVKTGVPFYIHIETAPHVDLILVKSGYEPSADDWKYCLFIENPQDAVRWVCIWHRWQATGGTVDGWDKLLFGSEEEGADAD